MSDLLCLRKHVEHVEGCPSCRLRATSDAYRRELAKLQGKAAPAAGVGEPATSSRRQPQTGGTITVPAHTGPGGHLKAMLALMGVPACQSCNVYAAQMDQWGVAGCNERRAEIIAHLDAQASRLGWFRWVTAGAKAVAAGLPTTAAGLLDEAIRRAEEDVKG